MNFSHRTWQDNYYDGYIIDITPDIDDSLLERLSYIEFLKDTQDDRVLWLKHNAQKHYYREPYKPDIK